MSDPRYVSNSSVQRPDTELEDVLYISDHLTGRPMEAVGDRCTEPPLDKDYVVGR
jgi:hypothetical protein